MNNFTKGILVGVGVGLLVAPLSGQETRRLLAARVQEWRNSLPEDSPINQYASQVADRVTSTKENWRGYAQQAVSKAKDSGSAFGNKAMQSGQEMASKAKLTSQEMANKAKLTSQEMANKAKQSSQEMANKAKQKAGFSGSSPNGASTRVIPESDE
jgi:gas vesicle protein